MFSTVTDLSAQGQSFLVSAKYKLPPNVYLFYKDYIAKSKEIVALFDLRQARKKN